MKLNRFFLMLVISSFAFTGHAATEDVAIATVGKRVIKASTVEQFLKNLAPAERTALGNDPNLLNQAVRSIILQQLLVEEATRNGWDKQPEVIARLARIREAALAESYLQQASEADPAYPSDVEVLAAYDANKNALIVPKQYRVSQIFIPAPADGEQAVIDDAGVKIREAAGALAKQGADFGAIARMYSKDPATLAKNGEIGWVPETQLQPEIRERIAQMKAGEISPPLRLSQGWHIVKLEETKASYVAPLAEVREQLITRMRAEKARANREAYLATLLNDQPIAINEIATSSLLKPEN